MDRQDDWVCSSIFMRQGILPHLVYRVDEFLVQSSCFKFEQSGFTRWDVLIQLRQINCIFFNDIPVRLKKWSKPKESEDLKNFRKPETVLDKKIIIS